MKTFFKNYINVHKNTHVNLRHMNFKVQFEDKDWFYIFIFLNLIYYKKEKYF